MIFTSFDALANRLGSDMVVSPFAAVMCDGDVRKLVRMRQYANEAFEALDKLNDECDEEFILNSCSKEKWDLGMDIDELLVKIIDVLTRLEALE